MTYPDGFDSTDPLLRMFSNMDNLHRKLVSLSIAPLDFVGIYTLETLIESVKGVRL